MYKSDYFCCLSPINQAHLLERKANQSLKKEKYEDAIALHQDAARLLQTILNQAKTMEIQENVLVSLQSQIQHHRKQDKLIMLRKEQREERRFREQQQQQRSFLKTSQEPFQDLINYSTTSIDSYDSTDLVSASASYASQQNNILQEHLNKREEVIKTLGVLVRQQQHQILVLSGKLKEKDDENKRLWHQLETLQQDQSGDVICSELPS